MYTRIYNYIYIYIHMRNYAHMTGSITYWFCGFLYYGIHFVLILSDSLLQNRFRIDSVGFFTTGSISYWFCWFLYYRIHFVFILSDSLLQKARHGRPRSERSPVETGPVYIIDTTSNVHFFVAGWAGGFLGGRSEQNRVKGEESTRGFPEMRPYFDDRRDSA